MFSSSSLLSPAAAAAAKLPAERHKPRPRAILPDAFFISPDVVAANTPAALKAEVIRRVEAFILQTIFEVVSGQQQQRQQQQQQQLSSFESRLRVIRLQLLVLSHLYHNLHCGVISTQRDVYYRLARFVTDQTSVNRTIQQLVQILRVPRQWLGVVPGTRGCVGGTLSFHGVDLRHHGSEGLPLPTTQEELRVKRRGAVDAAEITCGGAADAFELHEQTRYIIVVEKHAVFFRLMEERIFDRVPCVLLTSHGFPTVTARTLLANIHRAAGGNVPVVALIDYNPSGVSILQQYKYSAGGVGEGKYIAVPSLHWLGVRSSHITQLCSSDGVDSHSDLPLTPSLRLLPRLPFQRFSRRDAVMMKNHLAHWRGIWESSTGADGDTLKRWYEEVVRMHQLAVNVELEALYDYSADKLGGKTSFSLQLSDCSGFAGWLCRALFRHDYI